MRLLWSAAIVALLLWMEASAEDDALGAQSGQPEITESSTGDSSSTGAPGGVASIPVKVRIPESTEFVTTEAVINSTIADCLRKDSATVEENGGLTVTAETFTDCARHELRRIQDQFDMPTRPAAANGPRGKSDKAAEAQGSGTAASAGSESRDDNHQNSNKYEDKPHRASDHHRVNESILAQHGVKGNSASSKDVAEAVANATVQAVAGSSSSSGSGDMLAVLQTVFDYKRVMNDFRRILRGDVFGVLGEYPGRMNGLFKMVHELPRRIMKSIGIVNRLRNTTTDTTFRGVLTNLKEYLTQASHTAKDLPTAFSLINVMDTLRNVAHKIGDGSPSSPDQQMPAQRALLGRVEDLLRNPIGEVFNMGPYKSVVQGVTQGRQILSRGILDFHTDSFIPGVLHPRHFFQRRRFHPSGRNGQYEDQS